MPAPLLVIVLLWASAAPIPVGGSLGVPGISTARAEGQTPPDPAGILQEARRRYRVENAVQVLRMTLVSKRGQERVRELEVRIRRDDGVLRSYTRFRSPGDVAGTQLVLVDHPDRADEQLLYLPVLKRVTRIAGQARDRSFVGSDFRFSDFEMDLGEGARHALASQTAEYWEVETTFSADAETEWSRVRTRIARSDHLPRRVRYYDAEGDLARELVVEAVEERGGIPVPVRSVMKDLRKGTATRLEVLESRVDVPAAELPDEMFTAAWLERNG